MPYFFFLAVSTVKIFFPCYAIACYYLLVDCLVETSVWFLPLFLYLPFLFVHYLLENFTNTFTFCCWKCCHRWWPPILFLMLLQLTTCIWPMFIPSFSLLLLLYPCRQMRFYVKVVGPFVKCFLWFRWVLVHMHSEAFKLLCKVSSSTIKLLSFSQFHVYFCYLYRHTRLMLSALTNTNLTQRSFTIVTFLRVRRI
jgi:hypothetical protein